MNGFYNKRDYLSLLMLVVFALTFSMFLVINFDFIYLITIKSLNLNVKYQISISKLLHNLHVMTSFIQSPFSNNLILSDYKLSRGAYQHFKDVRRLVMLSYVLLAISGGYLIYSEIFNNYLKKCLWKISDYIKRIILLLITVGSICLLDFNDVFIYFHQLLFSNHNWVFNPKKDPVIKVLPDQYFLACFISWFLLVLMILLIAYLWGKYQIKKKKL